MPKILALLEARSIILTAVERTMATGHTVIMQTTDRADAMILNNCCIMACELQAAVGDWETSSCGHHQRSSQQKNLCKIGAENCC
jgi:predicted transglutaminase-like cysteine proteinase